jgi:hypothetical protein
MYIRDAENARKLQTHACTASGRISGRNFMFHRVLANANEKGICWPQSQVERDMDGRPCQQRAMNDGLCTEMAWFLRNPFFLQVETNGSERGPKICDEPTY